MSTIYTINPVADETEQCYVTKTFRERQRCASYTHCWITFLSRWNENIPLCWISKRMLSACDFLFEQQFFSMRLAFIELLRMVCFHFFSASSSSISFSFAIFDGSLIAAGVRLNRKQTRDVQNNNKCSHKLTARVFFCAFCVDIFKPLNILYFVHYHQLKVSI